jgi:hypothetical protein
MIGRDGRGQATMLRRTRPGGGIATRARSPSGTLTPIKAVSAGGTDCEVGVDAAGDAVFGWRGGVDGKSRVFARSRSASGTFGPPQMLSPAGYDAYSLNLAVDSAGAAAATWIEGVRGFAIQVAFGP